jgi:hypothetical protein
VDTILLNNNWKFPVKIRFFQNFPGCFIYKLQILISEIFVKSHLFLNFSAQKINFMKRKVHTALLVGLLFVGISACKSNDDNDAPCSVAWTSELSAEINDMSVAAQAYAADQSVANCNAYKQSVQAYLNALRPYGDCTMLTGQQRIAWESALADAQENVDNMNCQ